jgi:bifunctional non-homologous end joining protein LigD
MPEFVAPQLCRLVDEPPVGSVWVHEVKFDGYRMQLRVANGRAVLRTRKALDWTQRFPEIGREAQSFPDCIMDGEICALDEHGVPNFAELQQALSDEITGNLIFFAFDLLFDGNEDLRNLPLENRKSRLSELLENRRAPHFRYVEHFATSGDKFLETACGAHLEGIISKRLDAPYRSGRGDLWTKEKCRGGQEVVIGGWWGSSTKLRSILIGAYDGDEFVYRGRIGTGFNSENSGPLLRALNRIKQPKSPFTAGIKPPRTKEITWVAPKLVAEVEYATVTRDGVLRQASFKALRDDKSAKAVVLELPMPVQDAQVHSDAETKGTIRPNVVRAKSASPNTPAVAGVNITNPDKVLWPAQGKTRALSKLDLARYYEVIGPRMLPHIAARPLSMLRSPEGITGERFFQRHVLSGVAHVMPIRVKGEAKPFHALTDLKGLIALAQAAVLEIHPWACRPGEPEIPELLIFDLDPDTGLPFTRVIEAAKEMRDVLTSCGMTAFAKTTGGKGIHVVTPITGAVRRPPSWDDAREFAREAAERLAQIAPDRYVTNMAKRHREGKIFIDFFRNARMATAVAPWSTRARPGAAIATPLSWTQFRSPLDPSIYNLAATDKVLKLKDPWQDIAASAVSLEDARRRLRTL